MGKINKGILGGFSGKVGNVIGGTWKGIDYMRSKASRGKYNPSQNQLAQQLKFGLMMGFLQPLTSLLQLTFNSFAVKMSGINNAMSYNVKNAVAGTYPSFSIDYSQARVSRGKLPNAAGPAVTVGAGGTLTWSWSDNSGAGLARPSDQAILVAFCPELKQAIYTTAGGERSHLTGDLDASPFTGYQIETYLGFVSADGKQVATSFYTGNHLVS